MLTQPQSTGAEVAPWPAIRTSGDGASSAAASQSTSRRPSEVPPASYPHSRSPAPRARLSPMSVVQQLREKTGPTSARLCVFTKNARFRLPWT